MSWKVKLPYDTWRKCRRLYEVLYVKSLDDVIMNAIKYKKYGITSFMMRPRKSVLLSLSKCEEDIRWFAAENKVGYGEAVDILVDDMYRFLLRQGVDV